jgi:hypothetical protein
MSFKFENLVGIDFIFEANLGYESREQVSSSDEKNRYQKYHTSVNLKTSKAYSN